MAFATVGTKMMEVAGAIRKLGSFGVVGSKFLKQYWCWGFRVKDFEFGVRVLLDVLQDL